MTEPDRTVPPRLRRPRLRRNWLRAGLATVAVLLVAGELVARYWLGLGDPPLSMYDPETEYRFVPGVYHRFHHTISYNQFSMRSPAISKLKLDPNELRVLVVGDSVINGGAPTDDGELATTLLAAGLTRHFGRPVRVCNISAGSWGPPNESAFLREFGWFDADALVVVVSSHDGVDAPTFDSVVGASFMPGRKPVSALWEGVTRYTRFGQWLTATPGPDPTVPSPAAAMPLAGPQCRDALHEMFGRAARTRVPACMVLNWERSEIAAGQLNPTAQVLLDAARAEHVPLLQFGPVQAAAIKDGKAPFRENDAIHPSVYGQRLLCDLIEPELERMLASRPAPTVAPPPVTSQPTPGRPDELRLTSTPR